MRTAGNLAACGMVAACACTAARCSSPPEQAPPPPASDASLRQAVDAAVETARNELAIPGVSIAVLRGNTLFVARGYGVASREERVAPSDRTIYPIGSISKHITAAAVMKLVEQGKIRLDHPISTYVPGYRPADGEHVATVRQLLLQRSGIPAWDDLPEMQDIDSGDVGRFTRARMIEILAGTPALYLPGSWWSYSNSNYFLLAAAIERVSGIPHDRYLEETLLVPLGLGSTGGCASARIAEAMDRAAGYALVDGAYVLRPVSAVKADAFVGAGGLCSTAADLVTWMRALVDGKAVSPASFREMTTAARVPAGFTPPYGYGLSLRPLVGKTAVWHIGSLSGFMSVLAYFPDHDVIIAVLANRRQASVDTIVKRIARTLWNLPEPVLRDLPISAAVRDSAAGEYDDAMFTFRVFQQREQLFVDVPPLGAPQRLHYQGGREFATPEPRERRFRFEPADGPIERVEWEWGEIRAYGRRVR